MELTNSAQMSCAHFLAHERQQRVRHTQGINPVLLTDDFLKCRAFVARLALKETTSVTVEAARGNMAPDHAHAIGTTKQNVEP